MTSDLCPWLLRESSLRTPLLCPVHRLRCPAERPCTKLQSGTAPEGRRLGMRETGLGWSYLELNEWREEQAGEVGGQCCQGWRPGSAPHLSES